MSARVGHRGDSSDCSEYGKETISHQVVETSRALSRPGDAKSFIFPHFHPSSALSLRITKASRLKVELRGLASYPRRLAALRSHGPRFISPRFMIKIIEGWRSPSVLLPFSWDSSTQTPESARNVHAIYGKLTYSMQARTRNSSSFPSIVCSRLLTDLISEHPPRAG